MWFCWTPKFVAPGQIDNLDQHFSFQSEVLASQNLGESVSLPCDLQLWPRELWVMRSKAWRPATARELVS